MPDPRIVRTLILTAGVLGHPVPGQAAGFALPERSAAGIGLANALVANPDETGAFPYNPAAMVFHDRASLATGALLIGPSFQVTTSSGQHWGTGADWVAAPMLQCNLVPGDRWRLGLAVNTPFGLETRWSDGTFPALAGTVRVPVPPPLDPQVPRGQPTASRLEVLDLAPSLAWRASERFGLTAGIDLWWGRSAQLDSTASRLAGSGTGLGYHLGALYRQGDWSLGLVLRSGATLGLEGRHLPLSDTLVALGRLPPEQRARLDVDLPWQLQLGVHYRFDPGLAAECDWSRTGWSRFDQLGVAGADSGATLFTDTNDWRDTDAWRCGLTWTLNARTRIHAGYAIDDTGQDAAHFSARVPDQDRQSFGLGLAHDLGAGYRLELGYLRVQAGVRRHRGTEPAGAGGINGSTALAGDYRMHADLFGVGLVKTF